jgi:N-acetylglucosamine-6-sulfatase
MAQSGKPNVLIIFTDDQPQYMMDPLGEVRGRIRDMGTEFPRGHADIPLCGPARVSLLTGLSVTTHECDTNGTWNQFKNSSEDLPERILPKFLKDQGYVTGHFGKYINGHGKGVPVPNYWDRWCQTIGAGSDAPDELTEVNIDGEVQEFPSQGIPSGWAAQKTCDFIANHQSDPWMAHYCPTIPHFPYTPTSQSEHLYDGARRTVDSMNEDDMSDKPEWMRSLPKITGWQSEYEGKLEELADLNRLGIKPIMDELVNTSQVGNTLIFYLSDNGYLMAEHRLRKKDQPYWESSQIPYFVRGPGRKQGVSRTAFVSQIDVTPTALDAAGVDLSTVELDGRSMWGKLSQDSFSGWRERMLVSGSAAVGPQQNPGGADNPPGRWWMLREGNKHFILHENGLKELYWMDSDPHQLNNVRQSTDQSMIDDLTDKVNQLKSKSGQARRDVEDEP